MELVDVFLALGRDSFEEVLRGVSMGKLRTYQIFDQIKARTHLTKLNSENLRKAAPRLWARIEEREANLASELAQAVLISHLDMIAAVLDFLEIPHEGGFFAKDADVKSRLSDGWQERAYERFRGQYTQALLLFYLNHLTWELDPEATLFAPKGAAAL